MNRQDNLSPSGDASEGAFAIDDRGSGSTTEAAEFVEELLAKNELVTVRALIGAGLASREAAVYRLIEQYNPYLVILPQDTESPHPGRYLGVSVCGDYHPCSAEFFLSFVEQFDSPRPWRITGQADSQPTGIEALRARVEAVPEEETLAWELDVAPMRASDAGQAWSAYRDMIDLHPDGKRPVVYARYVEGVRPVIQYWYLFPYNDGPSAHEGDWEMISIELNVHGLPVAAGYRRRAVGERRSWRDIQMVDGHPVAYVAAGSHAFYFEHRGKGHRIRSAALGIRLPLKLHRLLQLFVGLLETLNTMMRVVDRTPSFSTGVLLEPEVRVLPLAHDPSTSPEFWWMRLRCRWGSVASRIRDFIGALPPWSSGAMWDRPIDWLDRLPMVQRKGRFPDDDGD